MNFKEFERLEKFNIMSKNIEELQYNSSIKGDYRPTEKPLGGLKIKNDSTYTRKQ